MNDINNQTRIVSAALAAAPFLFALFAIGQGQSMPAAEYDDYDFLITLTVYHGILFGTIFAGANILSTFLVNSVAPERKVFMWYLFRQAIREGVALFGCVIYYLGVDAGQLHFAPWLWINLVSTGAFVFFSMSDFPNDDRLLDRARRLGL